MQHRSRSSRARRASAVVWALVAICSAAGANAEPGAGSLYVAGAAHTPTHWNIPVGAPTTAQIRGVSPSEVGDPLPPTIVVFVKSASFGNVQLTAGRIGATNDYAFTYLPDPGLGSLLCGSTAVAYVRLGLLTNNDLLDDGQQNGGSGAMAGFRFISGAGQPLECKLAVQSSPWGLVKERYR